MLLGLVGVGRIGAFHAETMRDLPGVDRVIVTDADAARAGSVAEKLRAENQGVANAGVEAAPDVPALFEHGLDGVVIAAATTAHPDLVLAAADAGVPIFCEKPLAGDVAGTRAVIDRVHAAGVALQVGFQRRFDPGYLAARRALRDGELGWPHTIRSTTFDPEPPSAAYIATSGGIFRDCLVHDFDSIRWLTGQEIVEVYATGANRGAEFFAEVGDVDTAGVVATLSDGTVAVISGGRYNGAGYDVRLEVHGSAGTRVAGLDDHAPLVSAEPGVGWPAEVPYPTFAQRFRQAYVDELTAFVDLCTRAPDDAGPVESPCTGEDALAALLVAEACELSRAQSRAVRVAEVTS